MHKQILILSIFIVNIICKPCKTIIMAEVISLKDFYTILCSSKPTLYKAIASLILSSGMTPTNLSKLRLNDFLDACEDYFHENEDKTLKNLLSKNPWEIIPLWKLKSDHRLTFSSPESTFYIFMYLNEKRKEDLDNLKDPLFKRGAKNFLTSSKISSYVTEFNKLNFTNTYFNSKNLTYTFEKVCNQHLTLEKEHKHDLIKLFLQGNIQYYTKHKNNSRELRKYYQMFVPFLTSRTFDFEKQVVDYKNSLRYQKNKYEIIEDYYNLNLKKNQNLSPFDEQLLCKFADEISNTEIFINKGDYLNKLFKKAIIRLKLFNYFNKHDWRYSPKNISLRKKSQRIKSVMINSKINEEIDFQNLDIMKHISQYLVKNDLYNQNIFKTELPKIIEDITFKLIT